MIPNTITRFDHRKFVYDGDERSFPPTAIWMPKSSLYVPERMDFDPTATETLYDSINQILTAHDQPELGVDAPLILLENRTIDQDGYLNVEVLRTVGFSFPLAGQSHHPKPKPLHHGNEEYRVPAIHSHYTSLEKELIPGFSALYLICLPEHGFKTQKLSSVDWDPVFPNVSYPESFKYVPDETKKLELISVE